MNLIKENKLQENDMQKIISIEQNYEDLINIIKRKEDIKKEILLFNKKYPDTTKVYSREKLGLSPINISEYNERLPFNNEMHSKEEINERVANLNEKSNFISDLIYKYYLQVISFDFLEQKISQLVDEKNFKELHYLNLNDIGQYIINESLSNYINKCDFKELNENLESNEFLSILPSLIDYDKKTKIQFKDFTKKQNYQIAAKILPSFSTTENIFHFFNPKNNNFIKEFVIEHLPKDIFYNFYYHPDYKMYFKTFIDERYTSEEIYTAYNNLEKHKDFLDSESINENYSSFFSSNFCNVNNKDPKDYLDFLDYTKDKNEKLYVIAINKYILSFLSSHDGIKDECAHNFFMKYFDFEKVLDGMKKIIEDAKKINSLSELPSIALKNAIQVMGYEFCHVNPFKITYHSQMSHEQTNKLMKFLIKENSLLLIETRALGNQPDLFLYLCENIGSMINTENIENFLYPHINLNVSFDVASNKNKIESYFISIIEHAIINKNIEIIKKFKSLINNHEDNKYKKSSKVLRNIIVKSKSVKDMLDKSELKIILQNKLSNIENIDTVKKKKI